MKRKLAVFFSHPTQHHSVMFNDLLGRDDIDVGVYYFDPGSYGGMADIDFQTRTRWDVPVLSERACILRNLLRGDAVSVLRQFNPAVIKIVLFGKYDAVYVAGYVSVSNWLILLCSKLRGARVLYQSDTNVIELREKQYPWWQRGLRLAFLNAVDTFLVIGDKNREAYAALGQGMKPMVWCPYPFDNKRFDEAAFGGDAEARRREVRRSLRLPEDALVVVVSGKLVPRKRQGDLIEIVRRATDARLYGLIIGSGPDEATLRKAASDVPQIVMTGFVNQAAIPSVYAAGDIGFVPSDSDPHPLVVTEMCMCGLPVVVSDKTGVWGPHDILRNGENGFVYHCGDIEQAGAYITMLSEDPNLRSRFSRRARELALTQSAALSASIIARVVQGAEVTQRIKEDEST